MKKIAIYAAVVLFAAWVLAMRFWGAELKAADPYLPLLTGLLTIGAVFTLLAFSFRDSPGPGQDRL